MAQCAAGRAYEDDGDSAVPFDIQQWGGRPGIGGSIIFDNADDPFIQIQGELSDEGGQPNLIKPIPLNLVPL
ncbi:MAG: hypothetical protein R2788_01060 [Saprospiraceae bacterium]